MNDQVERLAGVLVIEPEDLAREFAVPVLARIPWHPAPDTWNALGARL